MSRRRVVQLVVLALVAPLVGVVGGVSPVVAVEWDVRCSAPGVILGSEGDDVLVGTNAADVICGLGGNDQTQHTSTDQRGSASAGR